jgi:hypothetical protein
LLEELAEAAQMVERPLIEDDFHFLQAAERIPGVLLGVARRGLEPLEYLRLIGQQAVPKVRDEAEDFGSVGGGEDLLRYECRVLPRADGCDDAR